MAISTLTALRFNPKGMKRVSLYPGFNSEHGNVLSTKLLDKHHSKDQKPIGFAYIQLFDQHKSKSDSISQIFKKKDSSKRQFSRREIFHSLGPMAVTERKLMIHIYKVMKQMDIPQSKQRRILRQTLKRWRKDGSIGIPALMQRLKRCMIKSQLQEEREKLRIHLEQREKAAKVKKIENEIQKQIGKVENNGQVLTNEATKNDNVVGKTKCEAERDAPRVVLLQE